MSDKTPTPQELLAASPAFSGEQADVLSAAFAANVREQTTSTLPAKVAAQDSAIQALERRVKALEDNK
jgi:hypothetical protein